jgi:hypothetical protein
MVGAAPLHAAPVGLLHGAKERTRSVGNHMWALAKALKLHAVGAMIAKHDFKTHSAVRGHRRVLTTPLAPAVRIHGADETLPSAASGEIEQQLSGWAHAKWDSAAPPRLASAGAHACDPFPRSSFPLDRAGAILLHRR